MQRAENMSSSLPCYNVQDSNEKESDLVNIIKTRNQKEKDNWTIWPAGYTRMNLQSMQEKDEDIGPIFKLKSQINAW
jgi:hypothetical protein